jgi:hypothetical protein
MGRELALYFFDSEVDRDDVLRWGSVLTLAHEYAAVVRPEALFGPLPTPEAARQLACEVVEDGDLSAAKSWTVSAHDLELPGGMKPFQPRMVSARALVIRFGAVAA